MLIRTRQLTKRFGQITAVDAIDLVVEGNGIVGFLGPNGAGKTTTMRLLTGFLPATSGTAEVCGHDVFDAPIEVKARVGYLPETPPLYPELSVGEYLAFVAEIRGIDAQRRTARVGEVMEQVGLKGWERRLTGSLSKGYRQRVGLAQAIIHDPPLLILDEPTSGLDPAQLVGIRALIRSLAQERAVVFSTHVLSEVEQLCDRVVLIHEGRLVGDGTVEGLGARVGAGPWMELILEGSGADVSAVLAVLPEVDAVRQLARDRYRLEGDHDMPPAVVALAVSSGWRIHGMTHHRASLQAVFLNLVDAEGSP